MSDILITTHWNHYLDRFKPEEQDIYFTEEYVRLYKNNGDSAECFIYREGEKFFLMSYVKRKINFIDEECFDFETAYGYGGPLCNVKDTLFVNKAFSAFESFAKQHKFVAGFIRFHPLMNNHQLLRDNYQISFCRKTVFIDLTLGEEEIWLKHVHSKHRNVIRKAQQTGLVYKVDEKLEHLDTFIRLYTQTMQCKCADDFYFFDETYFLNLKKCLQNNIFLGLIIYRDKIIAASLFFHYGIYGHYHLSGRLEEYLHLCPNNLLIYRTALYLKKLGISYFHLGGGINGNSEDSLYKFKKRFSKNESSLYIGKIIFDKELYGKICSVWESQYPERKDRYENILLKYRC